jgi:hypothetical protein
MVRPLPLLGSFSRTPKQDRDEKRRLARRLDQLGSGVGIEHRHLLPLDLWRLDGVGGIAG